MQSLNNTAAEGAGGFKDFLQIIDKLERAGAEKDWCKEASGNQVVIEDYIP